MQHSDISSDPIKKILAFGDSNTYGLIPGTNERYIWGKRWTSILQERVRNENIRIIEEGLCGRTTVFEDALRPGRRSIDMLPSMLEAHSPLYGAVIMLGTNDCKTVYHASSGVIAKGMERCIEEIIRFIPRTNILLLSPVLLGHNVYHQDKDPEFDKTSVLTCAELKYEYKKTALRNGISFLAADEYAEVSEIDEEHLTEAGHAALAEAIYGKLIEMGMLQ